MKVGIYFSSEKRDGGVYQYSLSILEALEKIKKNQYIIFSTSAELPKKYRKNKKFKVVDLYIKERSSFYEFRNKITSHDIFFVDSFFDFVDKLGFFKLLTPILKIAQAKIIREINKNDLDIIIYPATSNLSFLVDTPSLVAVHDLQHIVMSSFKEAVAWGRKQYRNYLYKNICEKPGLIIVNSEVGKEDLVKYFKVEESRVSILPYLPSETLNNRLSKAQLGKVKEKLYLPNNYFFYPSKFWPHKNHIRLIKALKMLVEKGFDVNLVLSGSKKADFSTFHKVMKLANDLGLSKNVIYLGYLEGNDFSAVYKLALALVMPTFFGPTNIPVYEAWHMGVPVITSDLRGCREQVADGSGLVVNPRSPKDMAKKMEMLINDIKLRDLLIRRGRRNLKSWTINEFSQKLGEIINNF